MSTIAPSRSPSPIVITLVAGDGRTVRLKARIAGDHAACPSCHTRSSQVHGRYTRRPMDLPWRGHPVRLELTVRRFRCTNPDCARRSFAEDAGPRLPSHARRTREATAQLLQIALTVSGEAGARLAAKDGLPTSPATLLRLLRRAPLPLAPTPRVLGLDDLALRRGQTYATLFVDLQTRRPVDLLAGRDADAVAAWLAAHPGVEVVARDRARDYADAARRGAPDAVQVADRFHLLQNASLALEEMLRGMRLRLGAASASAWVREPPGEAAAGETRGGTELARRPPVRPAGRGKRSVVAERRKAKDARWQAVKAMAEAGASCRRIAKELGVSTKTVQRLRARPEPVREEVARRRPGGFTSRILQPYLTYLQDRWEAGCTNADQLLREIRALGYAGSRATLFQAVQPWRGPQLPTEQRREERRATRSSALRWLCLRPPEHLRSDQREVVGKVLARYPQLNGGYHLLQRFRRIVAERDVGGLDGWLEEARSSRLPTFAKFAKGIAMDRGAVDGALTLPWSNGPLEGHINRVKLIKRQGYGRAKLDLLRVRVLAA